MPLRPLPTPNPAHPEFRAVDRQADRRAHDRAQAGPHPTSHIVPFELEDKSCSRILSDLLGTAPKDGMTVRALIHALGERGLLMACMVFALPSMLPIPIPGMSIPQGTIIMLIGIGLLLNRAPMLPERLLEYRLPPKSLLLILDKGARLFARIEKLSYPRLLPMTHGWVHGLNGILLVGGAIILLAPLPIPFSNVLPAYGILFTAFGTLQRDGWLVIAGYVMYLLTVVYIALVFLFGMAWIYSFFH